LRRKSVSTLMAVVGLTLSAGTLAGIGTAGAATPRVSSASTPSMPNLIQQLTTTTTAPAPAAKPAPAPVPAPVLAPAVKPSSTPAAPAVKPATSPTAPLTALPISLSLPITLLNNVINGNVLPGQDSTTGTNTTTQTSPLANIDAPINICSISVALGANAVSSCSTESVGLNQVASIAAINIPITAQWNAIALGQAAAALGPLMGQGPASTTQNGAVNVYAPVSICAINVGLGGNTGSACNLQGTNGVTSQTGVIDAAVPVTVCDVIVEIAGNSTSNCPQYPDKTTQSGMLADLYAPATVCGVIAEVDGTATGSCMPVPGFPLANSLPTNSITQSAPIDGVLPINACSIVVAVDGSASNQCEPAHTAPTQTGPVTGNVPVTVCSITAAIQGTATGVCTGPGNGTPISVGTPGSPGTGVTIPITICGIEAALGGVASATCPNPTTSTSPPPTTTPSKTSPTTVPVKLASTAPTSVKAAAPAAASGPLAFTGAPLLLELLIGAMALLTGFVISKMARRQSGGVPGATSSER
jgi:hypothetical protein